MSTDVSDSLLKLLVEVTRRFEAQLNDRLKTELDVELRPAHYAVFRYLEPAGTRVTALAEAAGMTQQSMGELVTHLQRRGLVERRLDPADRRARLVVATAAGRAAVAVAAARIAEIEERLRSDLGADAVEQVRRSLVAARASLSGAGT
ncbi:MarR family winged helix-turn-helix transcriptional regulator [Nocardia spumae]|uniref:MarR family winged helix-turn-helix transcriptional regulator n=1 Tax=Nocardia spumae TaxID=2887190 RepID=UPI001D13DB52|nr:helix-turn-helix domain-containing protein [Nocardia spumae]